MNNNYSASHLNSNGKSFNLNPINRFKQLSGLTGDRSFDDIQASFTNDFKFNKITNSEYENSKPDQTDESIALGKYYSIELNEKLNNHK